MTTTSNADTICDQMSEEPEIIELIDDSDEMKDNITQESLPNYMHADTSQTDYINCIQLDDCDDDGIIKSDIDLKPIDMNNSILSVDSSQNLIIEEFRPAESFDNLIKPEINQQQPNNSEVINSLNKTDNNLEMINNQINLEKSSINNLTLQQTDNLNSSFNDSFTSINERVLHLESKLEINTEANQQQLNNQLDLELNDESNQKLNNESNQELNKEHEKLMNLSLPNDNTELGIIKIPGRNVPDCKYRTITLKILPPSQPSNQTTQSINSVMNQTIKREQVLSPIKREQVVSPIKISTVKTSPIKTINSTTKPTIQKINLKNENQLNKSEIKNEIKNDNQINLSTNKSIKRPIDQVDEAILKINKKICITEKCKNIAIDSVDWNSEYCSSKCLIKNCQEIFRRYVERKKIEKIKPLLN